MIDITEIKSGITVKLADGQTGVVKGSHLSSEGFVLRVHMGGGIVTRNVPLKDVTEIVTREETE